MSDRTWWEEEQVQRRIDGIDDPEERQRAEVARLWERWSSMVPPVFLQARLGDFAHVPVVQETLAAWARRMDPPNLLIYGPVGTGKTRAAFAACREQVRMGKRLAYWSVGRLLDALDWRNPDAGEEMTRALRVDVLVLDDLGSERESEWGSGKLYTVLNERWSHQRPVVATSNYALKPLEERLGEQAYSRLVNGDTVVLRLSGEDRRRVRPESPETPPEADPRASGAPRVGTAPNEPPVGS